MRLKARSVWINKQGRDFSGCHSCRSSDILLCERIHYLAVLGSVLGMMDFLGWAGAGLLWLVGYQF
jgi:hypothetical protein